MLKHIVLFKLKEENLEPNCLKAKKMLEELNTKIPEIVCLNVKIDNINPENFHLALYSEFKNLDDLKTYAVHPEHLKCVDFLKPLIVSRACVDSEE